MQKYNLALTPNHIGSEVIKLAQRFQNLSHCYLLDQNSLPHVTLYHFTTDENLETIWKRTCELWQFDPISLTFSEFNFGLHNGIYWISLLPDKQKLLHHMHETVAQILNLPIKSSFEPHMTLINTQTSNCQNEIATAMETYTPLQDTFTIALGKSDKIGQLTEILWRKENDKAAGLHG